MSPLIALSVVVYVSWVLTWTSAARLVLSIKSIPYTTQFLTYTEITPVLSQPALRISPHPNFAATYPFTPYTVPAIRLSPNKYLMDSIPIANALESVYHTPALHPSDLIVASVQKLIGQVMGAVGRLTVPKIVHEVLDPESAEAFTNAQIERGLPHVDEIEEMLNNDRKNGGPKVNEAWDAAQEPVNGLAKLLGEKEGPYFEGHEVRYADVVLVAALECARRVDEDGFFRRWLGLDATGRLLNLYQVFEKEGWLERDW